MEGFSLEDEFLPLVGVGFSPEDVVDVMDVLDGGGIGDGFSSLVFPFIIRGFLSPVKGVGGFWVQFLNWHPG